MIGERLPFNSLWADHNLYRGQPPVLCSIRLRPFQKGLVRWSRHRLTRHHVTITIIIIASYIQERRHWSRRSDSNTFQLVILLLVLVQLATQQVRTPVYRMGKPDCCIFCLVAASCTSACSSQE